MSPRKTLAIILPRFPYPLDKGDKLRAYHQIVHLSKSYDIFLYALTEDAVDASSVEQIKRFCVSVELFRLRSWEIAFQTMLSVCRGYPVQVGYFYSPGIRKQIQHSIGQRKPDAVYCQLSRTALYGKDLPFRKVIDLQDAFSKNYERIQSQAGGLKAIFYRYEATKMRAFERAMTEWFDEATIISAFDKDHIAVQPNRLHVVANGVDTDYFRPMEKPKQTDLLFSGNLSYLPNRQAVDYLVERIVPELTGQLPDIRIRIVGAAGHTLARYRSGNVEIKDWVADIRDEYAGTTMFVAPLFTGAGLQNKLLEAMSMGIPCITTSVANASLGAVDGEHLLIADDAGMFAAQIRKVLNDPGLSQRLSVQGRAFVMQRFNWVGETDKLSALF